MKISEKQHDDIEKIKQKLLQYNENMAIHCFFQHNKQIAENSNRLQIILFDKTLQLTVCLTNENENEKIYENSFETDYKTNSHNVKHKQKKITMLLNMNVIHAFSIMNHKKIDL